ncbi:MAG: DUF881 domain-containing protein [Clostridiales bacterium]|nr:DUF881 domain-containing protein [Clostridiales bacterium]
MSKKLTKSKRKAARRPIKQLQAESAPTSEEYQSFDSSTNYSPLIAEHVDQIKSEKPARFTTKTYIAIICLIVGFALSLQIKSVIKNSTLFPTSSQRVDTLVNEVMNEKNKNDELLAQVDQYKQDLAKYQDLIASNSDSAQAMLDQLNAANESAGLVNLNGPGVVFSLSDSQNVAAGGEAAGLYIIHDSDLLQAINELRNAGAEALSLNGERLLSTTSVRCVGSVVTVNGKAYSPPYEITAIGDPNQLEAALKIRNGVYDLLSKYGFELSIRKMDKVTVPRYNGTIKFEYAKPAE